MLCWSRFGAFEPSCKYLNNITLASWKDLYEVYEMMNLVNGLSVVAVDPKAEDKVVGCFIAHDAEPNIGFC